MLYITEMKRAAGEKFWAMKSGYIYKFTFQFFPIPGGIFPAGGDGPNKIVSGPPQKSRPEKSPPTGGGGGRKKSKSKFIKYTRFSYPRNFRLRRASSQ